MYPINGFKIDGILENVVSNPADVKLRDRLSTGSEGGELKKKYKDRGISVLLQQHRPVLLNLGRFLF